MDWFNLHLNIHKHSHLITLLFPAGFHGVNYSDTATALTLTSVKVKMRSVSLVGKRRKTVMLNSFCNSFQEQQSPFSICGIHKLGLEPPCWRRPQIWQVDAHVRDCLWHWGWWKLWYKQINLKLGKNSNRDGWVFGTTGSSPSCAPDHVLHLWLRGLQQADPAFLLTSVSTLCRPCNMELFWMGAYGYTLPNHLTPKHTHTHTHRKSNHLSSGWWNSKQIWLYHMYSKINQKCLLSPMHAIFQESNILRASREG